MSDYISLSPLASWPALLFAFACLIFAYAMFSLVGFGTAMIASAPLAMVLPVSHIVPLFALLDFTGAASRAGKNRRDIDWHALCQLLPGMLAGQWLGVTLLMDLPARWMALLLGSFVIGQGLLGLTSAERRRRKAPLAWPHAIAGGILGGLFGSGGFMYARYLEQRLPAREAFRATQALLIGLSTAWRIILCIAGGALDLPLLLTAIALLPAIPAGHWLAGQIDRYLSRQQLGALLHCLLLLAGSLLIWKNWQT